MVRAFVPLSALALLFAAPVFAAPVTLDQTCHFSGPAVHADLNGESVAFDLTNCVGTNSAGTTTHLVFELRQSAPAREQGARQLNLITQYAYHRAIDNGQVHVKLDDAEAFVDGHALTVELPVQANGLDLLPAD